MSIRSLVLIAVALLGLLVLANSVYVFTNNFVGSGTVSFGTTSFEGPGGGDSDGGRDLAIGDIDGDGRADIVGTFYRSINDAQVVVFEQNTLGVWTKTTTWASLMLR